MQERKKIAVAGATGRVGHYVVDVLKAQGHDAVAMSRSSGVDVITGTGLAEALIGVESIIDVATGPSPDQEAATQFFTTAARNLIEAGERAGVRRIVVVSIIGADRFAGGYNAAKVAHERAMLSGSIPVRILRAAQFHEFVAQLMEWARLLAARRNDPVRIEGMSGQADPDAQLMETDALLPGPDATLAGPTFEVWLDSTS
jgi:uncharacterized protein YbjT (DUF2867 family)